jgi:hypothetical protein
MTEVNDVLNGYNPELMVKIWNKMCDQVYHRPEDVLVERLQTLSRKDIEKNNTLWGRQVKQKKKKSGLFSRKKETGPVSPIGIIKKAMEEPEEKQGGQTPSLHGVEDEIDRRFK